MQVFIGLENINPESLLGTKKRQNKIWEYREMLMAWRRQRVRTWAGYILGFPSDTPETVSRDLELIQRELPIDALEFFVLTPLPGSEDHKKLHERGAPMDPDMNNYDLEHVCAAHPRMSREIFEQVYRDAWAQYYSDNHVETVLKRSVVTGLQPMRTARLLTLFAGATRIEGVHPLQIGVVRRKVRTQRRPGMPIVHPLLFHPWRAFDFMRTVWRWGRLYFRHQTIARRVLADPATQSYTDRALQTGAGDAAMPDLVEVFSDKIPNTYGAPRRQTANV
jgi:hypothetical protein